MYKGVNNKRNKLNIGVNIKLPKGEAIEKGNPQFIRIGNEIMEIKSCNCKIFKGNKHIPLASISEEVAQNCIVTMAPSKTFNVAGFSSSLVIIPNPFKGDYKYIIKPTNYLAIFGLK